MLLGSGAEGPARCNLTPEEFYEGHPVVKHYMDCTPQAIRPGMRCDAAKRGRKAVAARLESPTLIVRPEVRSSDGRLEQVGDNSNIEITITVSNRNDSR